MLIEDIFEYTYSEEMLSNYKERDFGELPGEIILNKRKQGLREKQREQKFGEREGKLRE
jgi:hypothetical protein